MKNLLPKGLTGKHLYEEPLLYMSAEFSGWRMDDFIKLMDRTRMKGRILPFVRGLRLSSHLIYACRKLLSGSGLTADWGHLILEDETFCSRECDVIIHREGCLWQWNDNKEPVMNFKFIDHRQAIAVISCKSFLRLGDIDRKYCESIRLYAKKIWLFAECCKPNSVEKIQERAKEYGYDNFWFIYPWVKKEEIKPNKEGWADFVREVKKLKGL